MRTTNHEKPRRNWGSILIRAAAVLFCLLMVSVYLMSGLFARYVSRDPGGDTARVAKFDVSASAASSNVDIVYGVNPNDEGAYTVTVTNNSEVAVRYSIRVVVEKAADSFDITVALEDKKLDTSKTNELYFQDIGTLPVSGSASHNLMFSVLDWGNFTAELTGVASRTEELTFRVYVDVVQAD